MKLKSIFQTILCSVLILLICGSFACGAEIGRPFNDVPKNQWYYNDVYNAYANKLFNGTSPNLFSPHMNTSRAMLVTVLYRAAGEPSVSDDVKFPDVFTGTYYTDAVIWATEKGIVGGYPDGTFQPNKAISREETVKILAGYYKLKYNQELTNSKELTGFEDADTVGEWALDSMKWAVGNGIISGSAVAQKLYLLPQNPTTRCQMAAVLIRTLKKYDGLQTKDYLPSGITDAMIAACSNSSAEYWFGNDGDALNRPAEPQRFQKQYQNFNTLAIDAADKKVIYLTFDCGYENGCTGKIIDILTAKNVPAVFFITGDYLTEAEPLVVRMINGGFSVGNHSSKHPAKGMPSLGMNGARNDIETLQNRMRYKYNYEMTLFRFPAGIYSPQTMQLINSMNMKSVFWSFGYGDYSTSQPGAASSLAKLKNRLHPGAVYLLHAISSTNAAILGDFIDYARAQGYTFALIVNK